MKLFLCLIAAILACLGTIQGKRSTFNCEIQGPYSDTDVDTAHKHVGKAFKTSSWEACSEACKRNDECDFFAWTTEQKRGYARVCHLKREKDVVWHRNKPFRHQSDVISGRMFNCDGLEAYPDPKFNYEDAPLVPTNAYIIGF